MFCPHSFLDPWQGRINEMLVCLYVCMIARLQPVFLGIYLLVFSEILNFGVKIEKKEAVEADFPGKIFFVLKYS